MAAGPVTKKRIADAIEADTWKDENGVRKVPLKVLAPPPCPHLFRSGPAKRTMICAYASEHTGHEIFTTGIKCRYECPNVGGPQGGREITEEMKGNFLSWNLAGHYRAWNPYTGIDKYVRKLASNPHFFVPPETPKIREKVRDLLKHPNVKAVAMVGSLVISNVKRPLKDHDMMVVVHDFRRYLEERSEFRAMLPDTHPERTDWFVGTSMSGTLGAVDVMTHELHIAYDFAHTVDETIQDVTTHETVGKWPERFQELINEAAKLDQSDTTSGHEARENWLEDRSFWEKATDFTKALASGREVDDETYRRRHISCHGTTPEGEVVGKPCKFRKESKRFGHFCSVCGCGDKPIASLSPDPKTGKSKLQFVELRCPARRDGFSNG